jgi:hypothetical protein
MSVVISDKVSTVSFVYSDGREILLDKDLISMKKGGTLLGVLKEYVYITNGEGFVKNSDNEVIKLHYSDVSSPVLASNDELITLILGYKVSSGAIMGSVQITDGTTALKIETNGSMPVTLQDQTSPTVIVKFSILEQSTTTTAPIAVDDYVIPVTDATGIVAGKYLTIFDPASIRFTTFYVVSVNALNVTVDSPADFAYPSGSYVDISSTNLAVNGAVTPVIAGLRNNAGQSPPPGIALSMDVTRLLFHCVAATSVDLTLFGDLAALTNGLLVRRRDGAYYNIFNVKSNGEMGGIMYDFTIHSSGVGQQGVDGFLGRLTFGGQNKMGVVHRININEDMETIIQDDLSGLTLLEIVAEGSIVVP